MEKGSAGRSHPVADGAKEGIWKLIRRSYRAAFGAAVLSILALLLYVNAAPSGAEVRYEIIMQAGEAPTAMRSSYSLGGYSDARRFTVNGSRMASDQVVFTWKVPYGRFDRAEAVVRYRGDPEELLLGIKGGASKWLETKPVHCRMLNELPWDRIEEKGLTLFQRENAYATIHDFLGSRRAVIGQGMGRLSPSDLAAYYFDGLPYYKEKAGEKARMLDIGLNLRGAHKAIAYIDDGRLELSFDKYDLNMYEGGDNLSFNVFRKGENVYGATMKDDGDTAASYITSSPQGMSIALDGLQDGFYTLVWDCGPDVLFRDLRLSCKWASFLDRVFMAQGELYGLERSGTVSLYTSARIMALETWHAETLQEVSVDGVMTITLSEPGVPVTTDLASGIKEIAVRNPNLLLNSPGFSFAVSRDSLLIPSYETFSPTLSLQGIDYIIANYSAPTMVDGAWERRIELDLKGREMDGNTLQLLITSPGLASSEVELDLISIELTLFKD